MSQWNGASSVPTEWSEFSGPTIDLRVFTHEGQDYAVLDDERHSHSQEELLQVPAGWEVARFEDADVARELITHHKGFNCNLLVTQDAVFRSSREEQWKEKDQGTKFADGDFLVWHGRHAESVIPDHARLQGLWTRILLQRPSLVLQLEIRCSDTAVDVEIFSLSGDCLCKFVLEPASTVRDLRAVVGSKNERYRDAKYVLPGGMLVGEDDEKLSRLQPDP
ncbi:hypothetical protein AK812_SmicGene17873 [Symbiodinium microadriaticum]|uniref:Uncharacterized protein n=1 Tax=Symbiodinium microadriaticum TaxID=2951 RepID=A0A1Q9DWL8_SYMMI|nr:hypothetical protein AK812_SmicGene17873 [Symbiodinium microadriaticum]